MHSKSSRSFESILTQLEATSMPNFSYRKVRSLPPTGLQLSAISCRLSMHRQAFVALNWLHRSSRPTLYCFRRSQHLSRSFEQQSLLLHLIACSFNIRRRIGSCAFSELAWHPCQNAAESDFSSRREQNRCQVASLRKQQTRIFQKATN